MSHWTALALVAGCGTLLLLSDREKKRQACEIQSSQKASSQSPSSPASSLSSSPSCSSSSLFCAPCGVEDLKRDVADDQQVEDEEHFSQSRRSIKTKTKKDLRSVGCACSSIAASLPSHLSSCSCSTYVIRKDAAVHPPSLSSLTGDCGGSTGEESQSPCSSCSRLEAFASVNARTRYDDGNDLRRNLDDGNDEENLDDDGSDACTLDDGNDEGTLDDESDARNADDDGNDGSILEEVEAHRLIGARRMPSPTAAAVAVAAGDEDEASKWSNSIRLVDIHSTDFFSRLQGNDWRRHFECQEFVSTRSSKDEKQLDGRFKWKSHPKRHLQNSASHKTRLRNSTEPSHETNLRNSTEPMHETNLRNNKKPPHKTNLPNNAETSHETNLPYNNEPLHKTILPNNTEAALKTNLQDKNSRKKTLIPSHAETEDKTHLPNNKKSRNKSNLPNNKRRYKENLPSNAEERDRASLQKTAQPSYNTNLPKTAQPSFNTNLPKTAQPSYNTNPRNTAESQDESNLESKCGSSDEKVAASSENSSVDDILSTSSFCCSLESEVWQKRDSMLQLEECHSSTESAASSDVNSDVTKPLSSSLIINQSSAKEAEHHRKNTNTCESKDGYLASAKCSSSQETITVTADKGARNDAPEVNDCCCYCDSADPPLNKDAKVAEENSSSEFGFEGFLLYDQPVDLNHVKKNSNVGEADLPRKHGRKQEELCSSYAMPSRAEQSLKKCIDDDSVQRSTEAAVSSAGIGVVTPSASSLQSCGTKPLVRWSFMKILNWTFIVLLLVLIVLYTLDHLFDLTRSRGHHRTDSTARHSDCHQPAAS